MKHFHRAGRRDLQEAKILKDYAHDHIVKYQDAVTERGFLYLVMEFCEMGDLAHFIRDQKTYREVFQ